MEAVSDISEVDRVGCDKAGKGTRTVVSVKAVAVRKRVIGVCIRGLHQM